MNLIGADIQGRDLILVGIERDENGSLTVKPETCTKLTLSDDQQGTVRNFARALAAFVRTHDVQEIVLKGRSTVGKFAGGAISFKIEGLVQSLEGCTVSILMPPTISAQVRKHSLAPPEGLLKYRSDAYLTACAALTKNTK